MREDRGWILRGRRVRRHTQPFRLLTCLSQLLIVDVPQPIFRDFLLHIPKPILLLHLRTQPHFCSVGCNAPASRPLMGWFALSEGACTILWLVPARERTAQPLHNAVQQSRARAPLSETTAGPTKDYSLFGDP